jgi:hypothetical protein
MVRTGSSLAVEDAERYDLVDAHPSHLGPADITAELQLTQAALAADYLRGISLLDLEGAFPDSPATLTSEELRQMRHAPQQPTSAPPNPARALTMERMKAGLRRLKTADGKQISNRGTPSWRRKRLTG